VNPEIREEILMIAAFDNLRAVTRPRAAFDKSADNGFLLITASFMAAP